MLWGSVMIREAISINFFPLLEIFNMKKRVLSLVLCCSLWPPLAGFVHAADTQQAEFLVLKMKDAKTAEFKLSTRPVISFADDKLVVTSDGASTDYLQSDVVEFYFTAVTTGIQQAANLQSMTFTYVDNANVSISGSSASEALLYDANGKLLKRSAVKAGSVNVNVAPYAPGVYILNLKNEHTFKIIKK